MKTLFISHVGSPGGAEYAMLSLAARIPDSTIMLLEPGPLVELAEKQGTPCHVLPIPETIKSVRRSSGLLASVRIAPGVLSLMGQLVRACRGYDVIVPMSQKAFVLCVLARALVRRPIVWYMNDLIHTEHFSRFLSKVMVRLANAGVDHVIVNSKASKDSWLQAGGAANRCSISYSGIDSARLANLNRQLIAEHRAWFSVENKRVAVMVGRIANWKGQHIVLEALSRLPDVRVVFVGDPLFGEQDYKRELTEYIRRHHMEDRAWFLGHRNDVLEIMAAADMVVHSSISAEPFGRVIVEGMMVGTPVIASDAGGPREIIKHGHSGLLTAPGDPDALRNAIQTLTADPHFARQLGQNGRARALELFDADNMVREFQSVRARCVGRRQRGSAQPAP